MRHAIDEMSGNVTLTGSVDEWRILYGRMDTYDRIKMLGGMSMLSMQSVIRKNPVGSLFASAEYVNETGVSILASVINEGLLQDRFTVQYVVTYILDYTDCDEHCTYCNVDSDENQQAGAIVATILSYGVPSPAMFGTVIDGYDAAIWPNLRDYSGCFWNDLGIFVGDLVEGDDNHIIYDFWQPWERTPEGHRMIASTAVTITRESGGNLDWTPNLGQ
jgi:hypothetical protein